MKHVATMRRPPNGDACSVEVRDNFAIQPGQVAKLYLASDAARTPNAAAALDRLERTLNDWSGDMKYRAHTELSDAIESLRASLAQQQGGTEPCAFRYKAPIFGSEERYWSQWIDCECHPQDLAHAKDQAWEIEYAFTHPAAVDEAITDVLSHAHNWRELMRNAQLAADRDDQSYWAHEIAALDRITAALQPATSDGDKA